MPAESRCSWLDERDRVVDNAERCRGLDGMRLGADFPFVGVPGPLLNELAVRLIALDAKLEVHVETLAARNFLVVAKERIERRTRLPVAARAEVLEILEDLRRLLHERREQLGRLRASELVTARDIRRLLSRILAVKSLLTKGVHENESFRLDIRDGLLERDLWRRLDDLLTVERAAGRTSIRSLTRLGRSNRQTLRDDLEVRERKLQGEQLDVLGKGHVPTPS